MSLSDFKSPYGTPRAYIQHDTDQWLAVETPDGSFRYFFAPNWTYFEKDLATEITEAEYEEKMAETRLRIQEEIERRRKNGGRF